MAFTILYERPKKVFRNFSVNVSQKILLKEFLKKQNTIQYSGNESTL